MPIRQNSQGYLPLTGGTLTGTLSVVGGDVRCNASFRGFNTGTRINLDDADGVVTLLNSASTGFTILRLGGGTSSFPGISRVGPAVAFRRADDTIGTFANLPAAAAANEGAVYPISDSTTATWGATITGGGANHVLAYSNGTNWTVLGK